MYNSILFYIIYENKDIVRIQLASEIIPLLQLSLG